MLALARLLITCLVFAPIVAAAPIVISFEGLPDQSPVIEPVSGIVFGNAFVLTAGVSVNEFEFPPHSGSQVVSDLGGPITISFSSPVQSFGGFFTYASPLTMAAYDRLGAILATVQSLASSNLALSGDPGSSPNEYMGIEGGRISRIVITGDPAGASFVADDLTVFSDVPEPQAGLLAITALGAMLAWRRRS